MPSIDFNFRPQRKFNETCPPVRRAFLIMKLVTVLILFGYLQVFAEVHSQPVTFSMKNIPFQQVLNMLKQTGDIEFKVEGNKIMVIP